MVRCKTYDVEGRPTGTVTFLFTDIEGSTRLWQERGDAMGAALSRHDEILREAVGTPRCRILHNG